ncbi:hypothetical protein BDV98DRAFT_606970 [Pterulicium gracile]|uniref:Secreted protein n=1 Tax=Pterulicium gracile TaxID=1884261 RepID=A0A5C3Q9A7_9AGAR|nr:hypothetical protein BDV98DRAFT_606970 [Pterula gracilis]
MLARVTLVLAAIAGCAVASPAAVADTTVTVTVSETAPWPHVCQTTVATTTKTSTVPGVTRTATQSFSTATNYLNCSGEGCGRTAFPEYTAVAAPRAREIEARAVVTRTVTEVYMKPTCVEYRDATLIIPTATTDRAVTTTTTTYLATTTANAINELCGGWNACPGSPYLVTRV